MDKESTRIFCEICKEECEQGNRPLGFLTSTGFKNLEDKFFNSTGHRLNKRQLKNKWDQMKKEFGQWQELRTHATGLGWNDHRGTIEANEEWWTAHLKRFPKHSKYRFAGPDHIPEMEVMFDKAFVNGALSTPPGPIDLTGGMEPEEIEDDDVVPNPNDLGGTSEHMTQTKDKGKRRRPSLANVDGSPYFAAYKATLVKWSAET